MPEQFRNVPQRHPFLTETARVGVPEIVPAKIRNLRLADGVDKPMGIDGLSAPFDSFKLYRSATVMAVCDQKIDLVFHDASLPSMPQDSITR